MKENSYLASGFDCLTERSATRLAVKDVCDKQILRGVHNEGALLDVTTDAEERQVTYSTFGNEFVVLKIIIIVKLTDRSFTGIKCLHLFYSRSAYEWKSC